MKDPFLIFWAGLIFSSIAWYGFLVFYVGIKAGREIRTLTESLHQNSHPDPRAHRRP